MIRENIKNIIENIQHIGGEYEYIYIPYSYTRDAKKMYSLYYGSGPKFTITKGQLIIGLDRTPITKDNIENITDIVFNIITDDCGNILNEALENSNLDDVSIKYFDTEVESFELFKSEIDKLKNKNDSN